MVKRALRYGVACVLLVWGTVLLHAEDIRVTARVDSSRVLIGDWVILHVDVEHRSSVTIEPPLLPDSIQGFEVIRRDTAAAKRDGDNVLQSYVYTLGVFDSGTQVIPPLPVRYRMPGDTAAQVAQTSPIAVFVRGIAVDSTQEMKDVKPPLSVPLSFRDILPYLIALVVLAGIVWLVLYVRKRRARGEPIIPEAPARPAYEVALEALRALASEKLWQRGMVKEYHSRLTDILRTYIERDFRILAMEMTSDEILGADAIRQLPKEDTALLRDILPRADLVKFAKYQPVQSEHEAAMAGAVSFVERTRTRPQEEPVVATNQAETA